MYLFIFKDFIPLLHPWKVVYEGSAVYHSLLFFLYMLGINETLKNI